MIRIVHLVFIGIFLLIASVSFAAEDSRDAIPRFSIMRYQVEGNTLIAADKLEAILSPFTGIEKDFGTVQEAIEELEKAYRNRGFTMVAVMLPEQELEKGVVRLKVIENRIGNINIKGNRFFNRENILGSLPGLRQGETPNINAVSRSIKLANENPAKKIDLQLKNSDKKETEIDANLTVKDEKPWKAGITADNTGDKQTGRSRMGFLLQHANVFNLDHLLTLQYITSPENLKDVNIYSIGYHAPFYSLGSSIDLIGAHSNVNSGTINVSSYNMDVSGKGTILGLHYNQNLTRIGIYEHKVTLGLDYRAYENNVEFIGFQLGNNVTVHPLSLTYAGTLTFSKVNAGLYLMGIQNLAGSWDGRDGAEDFENARTGARRSYNMLRYGVNLGYAPGGDWQVRAVFNGQYTNDPLVPGEQYGIGGANSVRGFQEREFSNDRGYSGSFEIYSPDLCKLFNVSAFQSRILVFYDRGYVSRKDPLPGETVSTEIAGIGPGLRITDGKRFSLSADCGFVVDPPDENTARWSNVWHLSASILF
ncbi:MAG: BamA/TamA family outer membrane protein [Deltaproteobacteria bacterium]|nr:BamA/TamA family outer membrane protein [Deltaproteobacteria bacterium]